MKIFKLLEKINPEIPYSLIHNSLKNFSPLEPSMDTVKPYEDLIPCRLPIRSATWDGWNVNDDVYITRSGGHSPDSMVFFLPRIKLLFAGDETYYFFPIWPNSHMSNQKTAIKKMIAMSASKEAELFIDGHHHNVFIAQGITLMLRELMEHHTVFQKELGEILEQSPKSHTVHDIYRKLKKRRHIKAVNEHFRLEFPIMPNYLKTIIAVSLIQTGYTTEGPYGKTKFSRV